MGILIRLALLAPLALAADPAVTMYWSADAAAALGRQAAANLDPERRIGVVRLMDSVEVIHRDGPSDVEVHTAQADFIFVRAGEAIILTGAAEGTRASAPGERRGGRIQGGTRYSLKAGDQLYIPAGMPHQFLVETGQSFTATIVKITPRP
jgi:mannose-6-phosphate isomerase-like protein (cupin superfamily)